MHVASKALAGLAGLCLVGAAQADIFTFNFAITTEQEVPAPAIPMGFDPMGFGIVNYDSDTNLLEWDISWSGLTGDVTAAHFHGPADFGMTAGPQVFIISGAGAPAPQPATGMVSGMATIDETQEANLLAGLWYVNLHTAMNGPGEIRGQVIPAPGAAALLGLGGLALVRRRRH